MKNYIQMMMIMGLIVGTNAFAMQQNPIVILPASSDANGIVNAIKQHSNLTKADEDKWKFLKLILGESDVYPASIIGTASAVGAGMLAYNKFADINKINVLSTLTEYAPSQLMQYMSTMPPLSDTLKQGLLTASAAAVTGWMSYKLLYPRMYRGVLDKVQKFIDVCSGLGVATYSPGYFPIEWGALDPIAKCKALQCLREQAMHAVALLNYTGSNDAEITGMRTYVNWYSQNLDYNLNFYGCENIFVNKQNQDYRDLQHRATWWSMMRDAFRFTKEVVTTGKDVANWTIENKGGIAAVIGATWLGKWYWGK